MKQWPSHHGCCQRNQKIWCWSEMCNDYTKQRSNQEYNRKQEWKSPNATLRAALDGTVFRAPILVNNIPPSVRTWKKPIMIGRHAYGDVYKKPGDPRPRAGKGELVFTASGWQPTDSPHNSWIQRTRNPPRIHNTDKSINSFCKACFTYASWQPVPLWSQQRYDFKNLRCTIPANLPRRIWEKLETKIQRMQELSISSPLIDDAVARIMKSEGGLLWAVKNYDGDVMSDMLDSSYGSLAMMTSGACLARWFFRIRSSPWNCSETLLQIYQRRKNIINRWRWSSPASGALRKRGELDNTPELIEFAQ